MKPNIEELRKKYMANPPEGMTSRDIRDMSEDELLDMDYFLNDDNLDDDHMFVFVHLKIEISYKEKKRRKPLLSPLKF